MADLQGVTIVIPARNEEQSITEVLDGLAQQPPGLFNEIIVVDGRSTDATVDRCKRYQRLAVRVIDQPRIGKGDAVMAGVDAAHGNIVAIMDADGSHSPQELHTLLAALGPSVDIAKGSRFLKGGASYDMGFVRSLGNRMLTFLVNFLFRTRYTDITYGYMVFRKSSFRKLGFRDTSIAMDAHLMIQAAKNKLKVVEVPCVERARVSGISKAPAVPTGFKNLMLILRSRLGA